ncbi:pectin lyase fold/virulence factor [Collybia nuda]|uniref:Pectin lyase fold/virulence factor n=1 Tax=Collybia nuda TaxID=64659 RepID=A0A9P6CDM5_9AGAR|nr:pectin lyase fold/virulence factor [Collybia nuda]
MKWIASIILFAALWSVSHSTVIEKRASVNDFCGLGYATGTTDGSGSGITTVTSLTALIAAVSGNSKKIVIISGQSISLRKRTDLNYRSGTITRNIVVNVGSNTSLIGARGSGKSVQFYLNNSVEWVFQLVGVGLRILNSQNVIIRNVKVSKVLAEAGDAVNIQASSLVCLDHLDLSSDRDHDIDLFIKILRYCRSH